MGCTVHEVVWNPPKLTVRFDPDGNPVRPWVVVGDHSYRDKHIYVNVPDGFRTDFTSYPRWLGYVLLVLWALAYWCPEVVSFIRLGDMMPWIGLVATLGILVMDPFGRELRASVFHDFSCTLKISKFASDAMYRVIMACDGVIWWRRVVNYWGVFVFGWPRWLWPVDKKDRGIP